MTKVYSNPARESDPHALPAAEVFWMNGYMAGEMNKVCPNEYGSTRMFTPGWYFQYCQPGCLPDSDPVGPFLTEQAAIDALREEAEDAASDTGTT